MTNVEILRQTVERMKASEPFVEATCLSMGMSDADVATAKAASAKQNKLVALATDCYELLYELGICTCPEDAPSRKEIFDRIRALAAAIAKP